MTNSFIELSSVKTSFEDHYLKARSIEDRVLDDAVVRLLPHYKGSKGLEKEWALRAQSAERFLNYVGSKKMKNLLEVGCGNGWFSNYCSEHFESVTGIDLNKEELAQAARLFNNESVLFYYWDIFDTGSHVQKYDCIVLNAVVQYFPDLAQLITRLKEMLNKGGEIHIMDSPFYKKEEIDLARKRSLSYYEGIGVPELANYYFHHDIKEMGNFTKMYYPRKWLKLLGINQSPFSWYRYRIT